MHEHLEIFSFAILKRNIENFPSYKKRKIAMSKVKADFLIGR